MQLLKATKENIRLAAETIKKGGLVIYPTDTVYGLGCDPFNVNSVRRIFEVKGRTGKPLPILAYSIEDAQKIAEFNEKALKIAKAFWPGPITLRSFFPKRQTYLIQLLVTATPLVCVFQIIKLPWSLYSFPMVS